VQIDAPDGKTALKRKFSPGKIPIAGRKQVYRAVDKDGGWLRDIICLSHEKAPERSRPLLEKIIENGRLIKKLPTTALIRAYAQEALNSMPKKYARTAARHSLETRLSPMLKEIMERRPL
jgi:nicotinate phosphoribosyltransferase